MNLGNRAAITAALAFAMLGVGLAENASAGTIAVTRDESNYSDGNGAGEFGVTTFTGGTSLTSMGSGVGVSSNVFQTFCLEANEHINVNTTYMYDVATGAVHGGYSGGDPDAISDSTAYLYHQFNAGTLSGYTYTQGSGRVSSAGALQLAFWYLEGELGTTDLQDQYDNNSLAQSFVSGAASAIAGGSWTGIGDVRVVNLFDTNGTQYQSLLVETTSAVPLPPAALLGLGLMAGMSGAEIFRRRRRGALV